MLHSFLNTNKKSLYHIKACILREYGKVKLDKYFIKIIQHKKFENSLDMITFYYNDLYHQYSKISKDKAIFWTPLNTYSKLQFIVRSFELLV